MSTQDDAAHDWIKRQLAKAPPLTDEQRARIVRLLNPLEPIKTPGKERQ